MIQVRMFALVGVLAVAGFGCAGTEPAPEVLGENLYRVDDSRLTNAYVDPTVDWQSYETVYIANLDVSNVQVRQPPSTRGARQLEFTLDDNDRALLQSIYAQKMIERVFNEGGYSPAAAAGPGTLVIQIAVVQIAPTAPKDDGKSRGPGRVDIYTEGSGSITIEGTVRDGQTGKVLSIFSDTHQGSRFWGRNDRFSNRQDVERIFDYWARLLASQLDRIGPDA